MKNSLQSFLVGLMILAGIGCEEENPSWNSPNIKVDLPTVPTVLLSKTPKSKQVLLSLGHRATDETEFIVYGEEGEIALDELEGYLKTQFEQKKQPAFESLVLMLRITRKAPVAQVLKVLKAAWSAGFRAAAFYATLENQPITKHLESIPLIGWEVPFELPSRGESDRPSDIPLPDIEVTVHADKRGQLKSVKIGRGELGGDPEQVFERLNQKILQFIGQPGNPLTEELAVVIEVDEELRFEDLALIISACTGKMRPDLTNSGVDRYIHFVRLANVIDETNLPEPFDVAPIEILEIE